VIGIGLSGLASGLDTESMIQGLLQIEKRPRNRLTIRESAANARVESLNDVLSRLKSLKTAAADLRSTLVWGKTQTIESSAPTKFTAKLTGTAAPGAYKVEVVELANAASRTYTYGVRNQDSNIDIGTYRYKVLANSTVDSVVAGINADPAAPVYAVKNSDTEIVFTSKVTGATSSATATGTSLTEVTAKRVAGSDASIRVEGVSHTSSMNVFTKAIAGVEVTVSALTNGVVESISIGEAKTDATKVKDKVKAFVEQYNSTVEFIRGKLKEERVANPQNSTDARKGVLFGDSLLNGALRQLRQLVTDVGTGTMDDLRDIGISTGATTGGGSINRDAVAGKLVLDEAKLSSAIDTNLTGVENLLKGVGGYGERLETLLDPFTKSAGTIENRVGSVRSELSRIKDSMTVFDRRLEAAEKRYRAQFADLERLLSNSQQQGSWLSGQIGALSR